jgi:hypothetical protein
MVPENRGNPISATMVTPLCHSSLQYQHLLKTHRKTHTTWKQHQGHRESEKNLRRACRALPTSHTPAKATMHTEEDSKAGELRKTHIPALCNVEQ